MKITNPIHSIVSSKKLLLQSGISITEVMVLMVILIPLCSIIPTLAKTAHFKMQVPQASRYLGWQEAMTGSSLSNEITQTHIQERILKSNTLAFQTQQKESLESHQTPLWSVNSERIHDTSSTKATAVTRRSATPNTQSTTAIMSLLINSLAIVSKGTFDLEAKGVAHHEVHFTLNTFGLINQTNCAQANTSNSTLCLKQKHVIYSNSLAAQNDQDIQSQVNSLKPLSKINSAANAISRLAKASWIFKEGAGLEDAFLHVETEALPADRLKRH